MYKKVSELEKGDVIRRAVYKCSFWLKVDSIHKVYKNSYLINAYFEADGDWVVEVKE